MYIRRGWSYRKRGCYNKRDSSICEELEDLSTGCMVEFRKLASYSKLIGNIVTQFTQAYVISRLMPRWSDPAIHQNKRSIISFQIRPSTCSNFGRMNDMDKISCLPRVALLDAWSDEQWTKGIQIDQMAELETLAVRTQNSVYEITVLCGPTGEVLVRGGKFFPEWTPALLAGSTFGGSFLKMGGIYLGMQMEIAPQPVEMISKVVHDPATGQNEFLLGRRVITTSPVQTIGVVL